MAHLAISCMKISSAAVSCKVLISEMVEQEEGNPTESLVLISWKVGSSVIHLKLPSARTCILSHFASIVRVDIKQDDFGYNFFISYWPCKRGSEPGANAFAGIGDAEYCDSIWIITRNTHCDCGKGMHAPGL